jgi:predicted kinase
MPHAKLIIVGGSLATGKSTLVRHLEAELAYPVVSMDRIKESLFNICGVKDRAWSKEVGHLAFPVFRRFVEMYLERGSSVIAESTFLWPSDAEWLHAFADRYSAELVQIWMTCDPRVSRERFVTRARGGERHPGHCDTLESVIEEFDERFFNKTFIPHPIEGRTLVVDTTDFATVDHDQIYTFVQRV